MSRKLNMLYENSMNKLSIIEYSRPIIKVIKKADLKENDSIYTANYANMSFPYRKNTTNKNVSVS